MIKLIEIPVYALSRKTLLERYERFVNEFKRTYPQADDQTAEICIERMAFPQRAWEHNHIVGYIDVFFDKQDVVFEIYLPHPERKRYHWRGSRKTHISNISALDNHFFIKKEMTSADIQREISKKLDWIIQDYIPNKYYVNREGFDTINAYIDYKGIYEEYILLEEEANAKARFRTD